MNKKIHNNLSIENLMKTDWIEQFDEEQQREIKIGLKENLDISWYANPDISARAMELIRWGLEDNLDVSLYANRGYSFKHMREIRDKLHRLKEDED